LNSIKSFSSLHLNKKFNSSKLEHGEVFKITLAALAHDIGHGAFSHTLESICDSLEISTVTHEQRSLDLLERVIEIFDDDDHFNFSRKEFEYLFESKTGDNNFDQKMDLNGLYSIISDHYNGIDCDRLDYLRRDMMNASIKNPFENIQLISKFQFLGSYNGRGNHIAFDIDDVSHINSFFQTRHQMFHDLYVHRKSEEYELFLKDLVKLFRTELKIDKKIGTIEGYMELTDE
jgi:HD superfamily phosphohydrolase